MGEGRATGRVGSDFLLAIAGRVNVSPSRVGSMKSDPWTTLGHIPTNKGLRFSFFFNFLRSRTRMQPIRLSHFYAQYLKRRRMVSGCAFAVIEKKIDLDLQNFDRLIGNGTTIEVKYKVIHSFSNYMKFVDFKWPSEVRGQGRTM